MMKRTRQDPAVECEYFLISAKDLVESTGAEKENKKFNITNTTCAE